MYLCCAQHLGTFYKEDLSGGSNDRKGGSQNAGRVALKTPEAWLSNTGTVAQSTPDYSLRSIVSTTFCTDSP
jgi:hypothetical protein